MNKDEIKKFIDHMKKFLLLTIQVLQLFIFFCLMSAGMLYFSARG